jgi:hypothetical protein
MYPFKLRESGNELPGPAESKAAAAEGPSSTSMLQRRKLDVKAEVESGISHFSLKGTVPWGFELGFMGST